MSCFGNTVLKALQKKSGHLFGVGMSPTPLSDNCVLPTLEHSLSVGRAAVLETGPLPPQDHKSGTVCRPISDYVGRHTASSGGY